jgi:hypothetical protein
VLTDGRREGRIEPLEQAMGRKTLEAAVLLAALGMGTAAHAGISPDTYDILTLSNGDSISGSATLALTGANSGDSESTRWITILDTTPFTGFTTSSLQAAFAFDMATAPELSTWATIGIGVAALSLAGYRARLIAISVV